MDIAINTDEAYPGEPASAMATFPDRPVARYAARTTRRQEYVRWGHARLGPDGWGSSSAGGQWSPVDCGSLAAEWPEGLAAAVHDGFADGWGSSALVAAPPSEPS